MRLFKILALSGVLAIAGTACADLDVTNLNDPDRERAITTPSDVETLISGSFSTWWSVSHKNYPGPALSTAADAHTSSWGNWGMRNAGWEPRIPFDNTPSYSYNNVAETPWQNGYAALAGVRDGLSAINDGIVIEESGQDVTQRAVAFGKFVQALSLSNLAMLFDQAFVVDETSDLEALELVPYEQVWAAALAKYAEAISIAGSNSFTVPSAWVGHNGAWSSADMVLFMKAFRVRYSTQVHRTEAERTGMDWNGVLTDLGGGIPFDFATFYDGTTWGWGRDKLHTAYQPGWARIDVRTVGPSDVSGEWEAWLADAADDRLPFDILTPDSRVTEPMDPKTSGKYIEYRGNSPFRAARGKYHFSNHIDQRWKPLNQSGGFVGIYPDFVDKEIDFLRAEAMYRTGNTAGAMAVVNQYRANGDLPPFTGSANPDGPDMCVPQMPNGSCGDLWEALKYEKRIELFHYGFGTEYFDDRGWGDLVAGTFLDLPVPGSELLLLLMDIYTFGGSEGNGAPGGGATPAMMTDFSPEGLSFKRKAFEDYRNATRQDIKAFPIG